MRKEETNHILEIISAWSNGEQIQYRESATDPWKDYDLADELYIDTYFYRIKPAPKVRPYASADEFREAQKKNGPYLKTKNGYYVFPTTITDAVVKISGDPIAYEILANYYVWENNAKCGIIE